MTGTRKEADRIKCKRNVKLRDPTIWILARSIAQLENRLTQVMILSDAEGR